MQMKAFRTGAIYLKKQSAMAKHMACQKNSPEVFFGPNQPPEIRNPGGCKPENQQSASSDKSTCQSSIPDATSSECLSSVPFTSSIPDVSPQSTSVVPAPTNDVSPNVNQQNVQKLYYRSCKSTKTYVQKSVV